MYAVNFLLRPQSISVQMNFEHHKDAYELFERVRKARDERLDQPILAEDGFGKRASFIVSDILTFVFIDVEKDLQSTGKITMMRARQDAKMMTQANADPTLRMLRPSPLVQQ